MGVSECCEKAGERFARRWFEGLKAAPAELTVRVDKRQQFAVSLKGSSLGSDDPGDNKFRGQRTARSAVGVENEPLRRNS